MYAAAVPLRDFLRRFLQLQLLLLGQQVRAVIHKSIFRCLHRQRQSGDQQNQRPQDAPFSNLHHTASSQEQDPDQAHNGG